VTAKVALVVGAGGVLGGALCEEFRDAGYQVLGLRRAAAEGAGGVRLAACDLSDPAATWRAANAIVAEFGHVDVAICNAAHLAVATFAELALDDFNQAWRVCVGSAVACARAVLPAMTARSGGALIVSGATASLRGSARFSAFASAKFALRGLAQSLAREYQPAGVHVAHVVLDGLLRGSASAARFATRDAYFEPREVAKVYRSLTEQHPSAWTHELDQRPHAGSF
jgi:NAD(P)-dependent dehydrogenase (short-subunit alcohol dehydrogenase family)